MNNFWVGIILCITVMVWAQFASAQSRPVSYCKFPQSGDVIMVEGWFCPSGSTRIGGGMQ